MSGFRMTVTMQQAEWHAMTAQRRAELQAIVDETCEPAPRLLGPTDTDRAIEERKGTNVPIDLNKELL
jgi:hypothetical protein